MNTTLIANVNSSIIGRMNSTSIGSVNIYSENSTVGVFGRAIVNTPLPTMSMSKTKFYKTALFRVPAATFRRSTGSGAAPYRGTTRPTEGRFVIAHHVTTAARTTPLTHVVSARQGVVYTLICIIVVLFLGMLLCALRYNQKRKRGFLHVRPGSMTSSSVSTCPFEITPGLVQSYRAKDDDSRYILATSPPDASALQHPKHLSNLTLDWPTPLYKKIDDWTPRTLSSSLRETAANQPVEKNRQPTILVYIDKSVSERQPTNNTTESDKKSYRSVDVIQDVDDIAELHKQTDDEVGRAREKSCGGCSYENALSYAGSVTGTPMSTIVHM